jgi:polyhydroxyalkanoate synthase
MPVLHSQTVVQSIDRDQRDTFVKELVVAHVEAPGKERFPLAMVRKRMPAASGSGETLAPGSGTSGAPTVAPVLLIHGYGQNRYAWHLPSRSVSCFLARAGFDVFNLDLRGHGRSRHLGAPRAEHVSEYAWEDVPAAVAEVQAQSGGRPVFLVGHSLGGLVSYAAAPKLGDAVAGIATLGSPYHFTRGSKTLTFLGELILALDKQVHLGHGALGLKPFSEAVRLTRAFIESPIFPLPIRGFVPGSLEPEVLSQHMSLAMDNGSITVLRNLFLSGVAARKSGHRLGGLTGSAASFEALELPLLVVAGTLDDLAPPSSVYPAHEHSRSSDKTYRAFPRGHIDILVGRDAPLTVWPLLEAWLRARVRRAAVAA